MTRSKKQLLLQALHWAGFLRLVITSQRNKITILMLHGVMDTTVPSAWVPLRSQLTTEQLSQALKVLSQYYNFISLTEATEMLAGMRPLIPNGLVLTFDDGYRNNLSFALPILRQFKIPATIFLSTGNVTEQKPFWFDRLDYAVQLIDNNSVPRQGMPELAEMDFSNRETLRHSFITFIRKEKQNYPTDVAMHSSINNLAERIEQYPGHGLSEIFPNDPWSGILTWNEIQQAASDVDFGSHGVNHFQLSLISPNMAKKELIKSREAIEFHTGCPCRHLAYPNGSFNDDVISQATACNYSSAVTTIPGSNKKGDNILKLRRLSFPNFTTAAGVLTAVSGLSNK
jgi:peptidoglycan/xylan/chitin deacetylase (PgdA/CDA1 family)